VVVADVEGVVDEGAAVEAVVVVALREERGRLALVAMVGLSALVDRCGGPLPPGPSVATKAATSVTAATVAPTSTILLRFSESGLALDSRAFGTGVAESRGS
jgi:hypothetical protein